jgi:uncharacterized protein YqiB (DUF1249 family)
MGNTIFERNYRKMEKLGLIALADRIGPDKSARIKSGGFMDLCVNYLYDNLGQIVSLTHYYEQNGDLVPDPDMVVRIDRDMSIVEVLTYQDSLTFRRVYPKSGFVDLAARKELNAFLGQWLKNLDMQGFNGENAIVRA